MGQKVRTPPTRECENDILTPVAPCIAFPLANPSVAPEPQVKINVFYLKMKNSTTHPVLSTLNKSLVLDGSLFLSAGTQGRKAAASISVVLS